MLHVVFSLALWSVLLSPQTSTHTSDIYRDEFKLQPESARLSQDFSNNAWIVLLYASRLSTTQQGDVAKDSRTDVVMEKLRAEVKTDGEWLFWFRLKNYSSARQAAEDNPSQADQQGMVDMNACRTALADANRAHVMAALMPACELARQPSARIRP